MADKFPQQDGPAGRIASATTKDAPDPPQRWTQARIDQVCTMRESGMSLSQISAALAREGFIAHPNSISWYCLRNGADLPPEKRKPNTGKCSMPDFTRGSHKVRRFTREEDAILLRMEADGTRIFEMCKALGRKHNSVVGRLATLARHEARAEDAA